jgi:hypothetical protein
MGACVMMERGCFKTTLIGLSLSLVLISCSFFQPKNDYTEEIVKGDSFTLAWNDDSWLISANPNKPATYRVYYRNHGEAAWSVLREIPASAGTTRLTVKHEDLTYGLYDFGVSKIDAAGFESDIHSSLDTSADPICGWYVFWIGSQ